MNTRREEEVIIADGHRERKMALAGEGGTFVAVVETGPMQGHR
jgi:hypothetical protein